MRALSRIRMPFCTIIRPFSIMVIVGEAVVGGGIEIKSAWEVYKEPGELGALMYVYER